MRGRGAGGVGGEINHSWPAAYRAYIVVDCPDQLPHMHSLITEFHIREVPDIFLLQNTATSVVGIHQKCLAKALLMNTRNMFSLRRKKNINIPANYLKKHLILNSEFTESLAVVHCSCRQ